jgi:hypothetical protein
VDEEAERDHDGPPFLPAVVAVTHGDGVEQLRFLAQRVEVDRHAERRAGLVLARVAATDRAAFVVEHVIHGAAGRGPRAPCFTSSGLFLSSGNTPTLTGATRGWNRITTRVSFLPFSSVSSSDRRW